IAKRINLPGLEDPRENHSSTRTGRTTVGKPANCNRRRMAYAVSSCRKRSNQRSRSKMSLPAKKIARG
ncbi:MAG: hypothetical protein ABR567_04700, partial [Myxococcales bacterium]